MIRPDTSNPTNYGDDPWQAALQMFNSEHPDAPEEYKGLASSISTALSNLYRPPTSGGGQRPNVPADQMEPPASAVPSAQGVGEVMPRFLEAVAIGAGVAHHLSQMARPKNTVVQRKESASKPSGEAPRPAPSKSGPERI